MAGYTLNYLAGTPEDIGLALGKKVKGRLEKEIDNYMATVDNLFGIDYKRLQIEAPEWFNNLPASYRKELEYTAIGAGCSPEKIMRWIYSDMCISGGCTSFVYRLDGRTWVGRNNDYIMPGIWNYISVIKPEGKIPVMLFGLEVSTFSGTGYNQEKLWLHYNWLPSRDIPSPASKPLTPFVFIRKALETCKSIGDVLHLLDNTIRDGAMNLFVIDGNTEEFAVLECSLNSFARRRIKGKYIAGANHYECAGAFSGDEDFSESRSRLAEAERLLLEKEIKDPPRDFIKVLAARGVEKDSKDGGTVYANVACPGQEKIWYAADNFPAASKGNLQNVEWSW